MWVLGVGLAMAWIFVTSLDTARLTVYANVVLWLCVRNM